MARKLRKPGPPRVLLYGHDSYGLGHLRRTLTLAEAIHAALPEAHVLIASGSPCATHFAMKPGVDIVKLPSVTKDEAGAYVPRHLGASLHSLLDLRRSILLTTYRTFDPDVLIVDHQPIGLKGELEEVLEECRHRGTTTFLGVRDIIDAPDRVARDWGRPQVRNALSQFYDHVCVYGSPEVFDTRAEYPIPPELHENVRFVGYVVRDWGRVPVRPFPDVHPQVLVTVGGGEDGVERVQAYLDAVGSGDPGWESTIVLGPLMDAGDQRRIQRRARQLGRITVRRFYSDLPRLLSEAHTVVAMAGYNTCAEILSARVPSVLLPRSHPRLEQRIRAQRLAQLGLAQCLPEAEPARLYRAIEHSLNVVPDWERRPDLSGKERMAELVRDCIAPLRARAASETCA